MCVVLLLFGYPLFLCLKQEHQNSYVVFTDAGRAMDSAGRRLTKMATICVRRDQSSLAMMSSSVMPSASAL